MQICPVFAGPVTYILKGPEGYKLHAIYAVYLADSMFAELEHKYKLEDIKFGEQGDIDVDCLINTHIIISIGIQ